MNAWDSYETRLSYSKEIKQSLTRERTKDRLAKQMSTNLSYDDVTINGEKRQISVIDETEFNKKKIHSLPKENLEHGAIVEWSGSIWLITEIDVHKELYSTGRMERCNHLLRWINDSGEIIERWCIVEDGTKYLIGEKSNNIMAIGDARIAVTVGKDIETCKLNRGYRFIIDDLDSGAPLAYQITKPNKLYNIYDNKGVFRFILNEVNRTDNDNLELRIADYYNWHPKKDKIESDVKNRPPFDGTTDSPERESEVWI